MRWQSSIIRLWSPRQRDYFLAGNTRPASWRKAQLEALKAMFTEHHDELCESLWPLSNRSDL